MKHLSGLDATFLYVETPEMPMHVGSLHLFDLPAGYSGDYFEDVKRHIAGRMHLAALFQRKLALMPFELANPVWVDDDDVDLDYHLRRLTMSKPGSMEQLEQLVGRLHSSLIDRSRPLWEFYVIEGFHTGQVAFYTKIHHAAMDGAAGVALANAVFDLTPQPRQVKPPRARPRTNQYQLGVAELAAAALTNTVQQYVKLAKILPDMGRAAVSLLRREKDEDGKRRFVVLKQLRFGPKTPINVSITNQRSFAGASLPLAEVKQLAQRTQATVNDVVLAVCSGALRRYLDDHGCRPARSLTAAVPVSLREAGNTELNNQVSMMFVSLASTIADPIARLAAIKASSAMAKDLTGKVKTAIPTDFPSFGAPWLMSGLASLYGRSKLANAIPPLANVAISNVPGPQVPLYMAGAKVTLYYPVSIPAHGVALNITVQSYNGALGFGLTACRRAMPDVRTLAGYLVDAHRELVDLVQRATVTTAPMVTPTLPAKRGKAGKRLAARTTSVAARQAKQKRTTKETAGVSMQNASSGTVVKLKATSRQA